MAKCSNSIITRVHYFAGLLGTIFLLLICTCKIQASGIVKAGNLPRNETSFSLSVTKTKPSRHVQFNKVANKLPSCSCGVKASHDVKIVGGTLSKQHSWPWVAAIVYVSDKKGHHNRKVVCGSSVITNTHLLTAGHCIQYIQQEGIQHFRAILGTNNINDEDAMEMEIASAIAHPKFNNKTLEYDVGILELESYVEYSRAVLPICLTPQTGVPYVNKTAVVAGWGSTYFGGAATTMQMQIMIGVISNTECRTLYKNDTEITSSMMCARRLNKDSCQGDSGGPLFSLQDGTNDHYLQIGIVSFGKGCGDKRYPGIYSRVSRFTKWINSQTDHDRNSNCSRNKLKNRNKASG